MNTNPLYSVGELKEIQDYARANDYLTVGWVLLSSHVVQDEDPAFISQRTVYALGWPRELGETVHPSTDDREERGEEETDLSMNV